MHEITFRAKFVHVYTGDVMKITSKKGPRYDISRGIKTKKKGENLCSWCLVNKDQTMNVTICAKSVCLHVVVFFFFSDLFSFLDTVKTIILPHSRFETHQSICSFPKRCRSVLTAWTICYFCSPTRIMGTHGSLPLPSTSASL